MKHLDYLNSFTNFESNLQHVAAQSFNLERVRRLFHALENPQHHLKFIHVAGTKGKGSTCAFAAYILRAAGYRVGLYTSPHLYRINERIRVLDPQATPTALPKDFYGAISDQQLHALVRKFKNPVDKIRHDPQLGNITYFEVLTGLALCHFLHRKTDIVVLETGLGGRLDATNAVDALVNAITPISLDHTAQLGNTISKIAAEKAAIIKNSQSKVVVGHQPAQAMQVIQRRCQRLGIKPFVVGKDICVHLRRPSSLVQTFDVKTPLVEYKNLKTNLMGGHQLHNAAMAIGMVELSGFKVSRKAVAQGIRETRWPGRFETVHKKPAVVVDCAHNTASADILMQSVRQAFPGNNIILVLGLSNDKDIRGISKILGKNARLVVTTQSRHPRAYHFSNDELKTVFQGRPAWNVQSVDDALKIAFREATKQDVILVAGSVFIAAEARALLKS